MLGDAATVTTCPFCLTAIAGDEPTETCPSCHAVYHRECWEENNGCAVYGCAKVPVIQSRSAIEIPISYWGQENKPCSACGQQILAAAVRCRHCGATFASARPENAVEFQSRAALNERLPEARRTVIWLFVVSVVPFLAPVGAIWGLIWHRAHREEVRALPSLYGALRKIGLATAIVLTVALVVLTCLYAAVRTR